VTGGTRGLAQFNQDFIALAPWDTSTRYPILGTRWSGGELWVTLVGWTIVLLACLLTWLLVRSPWGRVIKSIREDEDAVRALGKNVYAYKMQALVLGGVIGALAGFVFALGRAAVQPDLYGTAFTFFVYTVLLLGGAARVLGPVVGAAIFWVVLSLTDNVLAQAISAGYISPSVLSISQAGQVRFMLVGLALMLLMIFRPQGIFGDRRELAIDAR
jgi:branched-chain amino acid transport system permease protein